MTVLTPNNPSTIGIVVPVYAGERYLERLVSRVAAVRAKLDADQAFVRVEEMILVDDGATDGSPELSDRLASQYPWIVVIHMSRNFGQHAATVAGIMHSAADWIVTLDEDLQHPPEQILALLRHAVSTGADLVYAKPIKPVHNAMHRDLTSRVFKQLMSLLTGDANVKNYNSFRLIRGPVARAAASVVGHDTYFDVCLSWFTLRTTTLPMIMVDDRLELNGRGSYNFRSLLRHASRMLYSSDLKLLRWSVALGFAVVFLSIVSAVVILLTSIMMPDWITVPGWTSLTVLVTFFGGFIIALLGLLLQYVSTMVLRVHGKPNYFLIDRSNDALIAQSLESEG